MHAIEKPTTTGPGAPAQSGLVARVLLAMIRAYQRAISPLLVGGLGNVCRFEPSCSRYAVSCIERHGALRGSLLSFVRLCKCHPFHPGGLDLPPPTHGTEHEST
jgi:putative membrane protein insertion efficiency factor